MKILSFIIFKIKHSLVYIFRCFRNDNDLLIQSAKLQRLVKFSIRIINKSIRDDLKHDKHHLIVSHIYGMYIISTRYHQSVQSLILNGFVLNSFNLLRSQLESLLIFLFFIEPKDNLKEIENRINKYRDWITIRMYDNYQATSKLSLLTDIYKDKSADQYIIDNYNEVKNKYNKKQFDDLNRPSFIKDKTKLADEFGFKELYKHIFKETSANIHIADISDRLFWDESKIYSGFVYDETHANSFWPVILSNMLLFYLILNFVVFFELKPLLIPRLAKIFNIDKEEIDKKS